MFKKYLSSALMVLAINLAFGATAFANTKEDKETKSAEKVKANIVKLGTGKDARVEIKLRDKTKLRGYIGEINENNFVVVNEKTGATTEVSYSNAKQVKGNNLSTGVKIAIGVGVFLAIIFILVKTGVLQD